MSDWILARRTRASGANAFTAASTSRSIATGSTVTIPRPARSRERENILYEIGEPLCFFVDDSYRPLTLLLRSQLTVAEQLGEEANLCERSAQLVRNAGNEIDAKLRELLLPPKLKQRGNDESHGQSKETGKHRQARAWKTADDETRGDVRSQRNAELHPTEALVQRINDGELRGNVFLTRPENNTGVRCSGCDREYRVARDAANKRWWQKRRALENLPKHTDRRTRAHRSRGRRSPAAVRPCPSRRRSTRCAGGRRHCPCSPRTNRW